MSLGREMIKAGQCGCNCGTEGNLDSLTDWRRRLDLEHYNIYVQETTFIYAKQEMLLERERRAISRSPSFSQNVFP